MRYVSTTRTERGWPQEERNGSTLDSGGDANPHLDSLGAYKRLAQCHRFPNLSNRKVGVQDMKEKLTIVGAGMAGLLAGNLLGPLYQIRIVETQKSLPNNHSAVLRFKTPAIGEALNIGFRRVNMIKTVAPWKNPVADALAYSVKNTGEARSDRSINDGTVVADRYIAPPDFIAQLEKRFLAMPGASIAYGTYWQPQKNGPTISTLPMPILMELLKYPNRETFTYQSGINVRALLPDCDAYASMIAPDPDKPSSRISITGNELIIEVPRFNLKSFETTEGTKFLDDLAWGLVEQACDFLGIPKSHPTSMSVHRQPYSKILPVNEKARHDFIYWASHEHTIFSLGRFATWRPNLLLDSLIRDITLIDGWIGSKSRYQLAKAGVK